MRRRAAAVGRAVDRVGVAADAAERRPRRLGRAVGEPLRHQALVGRRIHAGREPGQHDRHVGEHRQPLHHAAVEVLARRHGGGVEQRRVGGDGDLFRDLAELERQLHAHLLPHRHDDARPEQALVAGHGHADLVVAWLKQRRFEVAAVVGHERLRRARVGTGDGNRGAGNHPLRILDRARDVPASFLRAAPGRRAPTTTGESSSIYACPAPCPPYAEWGWPRGF